VVVADVDGPAAAATVAAIAEQGGTAEAAEVTVADPQAVADLLSGIDARYSRLDVAVNCAGIEQPRGTIVEAPVEHWDRVLEVNLRGMWLCLKHELALMYRTGAGSVVNISSMVAHKAAFGAASYVAAKHGIIGLTRAAALESAPHGVRVNSLSPGHISTPMVDRVIAREPEIEQRYLSRTPLGRLGTADEVAAAAVWLCSAEASFITGSDLGVDGGVLL